jgi:type IV pilus assembly protein PilA
MKSMQKGFTLIELMIVVAIIAILAAIAIPQYQAYVIRSQVTRAMGEAGDLKVVVEDCLNNGLNTVGAATGDCISTATGSDILTGAAQGTNTVAAGMGVPQISTPLSTYPVTITATLGGHSNSTVTGGTITWSRDASGNWTCYTDGTTVTAQYSPASCQPKAAG